MPVSCQSCPVSAGSAGLLRSVFGSAPQNRRLGDDPGGPRGVRAAQRGSGEAGHDQRCGICDLQHRRRVVLDPLEVVLKVLVGGPEIVGLGDDQAVAAVSGRGSPVITGILSGVGAQGKCRMCAAAWASFMA